MAFNFSPKIITNGLVLYLDAANERSYNSFGTTWYDLSLNKNNGTLNNGVQFNDNDNYFIFNGTNNYVSTTTNLGSNPIPIHSISVWFKTSIASGGKIIGVEDVQTGEGAGNHDRHIYIGTDGKIYYGIFDTTYHIISSTTTLNDNKWHNAVGICTGNNQIYLYIDGVLNSSGTGNAYSSYPTSYIRLGSYKFNGWTPGVTGYYSGNIAVAQVYDRALSSTEVLQNFNTLKGRFGL